MIFDTSVWVDFSNGKTTEKSELLKQRLLTNADVFICPAIIQEILQGCSSFQQFLKLKDLLMNLELLRNDEYEIVLKASQMYFQLRKNGITVRKPNDCLIAVYALENGLSLIHNDKDFDQIAQLFPLRNNEY